MSDDASKVKFDKAARAVFDQDGGAKLVDEVIDLLKPDGGPWVYHFFAHDLRVNKPHTPGPNAVSSGPAGFVNVMRVTVYQDENDDEGMTVPQREGILPRFVLARVWPDLRIAHYQLDGDGIVNLH